MQSDWSNIVVFEQVYCGDPISNVAVSDVPVNWNLSLVPPDIVTFIGVDDTVESVHLPIYVIFELLEAILAAKE
jgi:hypothetical protein